LTLKNELYFSHSLKHGHRDRRVIKKGKYLDFYWTIISYGTHPCAYVAIPKGHRFFAKDYSDYDKMNVDCHGGLTFGCAVHGMDMFDNKDYCWIGWDYAHAGDYNEDSDEVKQSHESDKHYIDNKNKEKMWTAEEIENEIKKVIDKL
jgi:hypothetical protein